MEISLATNRFVATNVLLIEGLFCTRGVTARVFDEANLAWQGRGVGEAGNPAWNRQAARRVALQPDYLATCGRAFFCRLWPGSPSAGTTSNLPYIGAWHE